MESNPHPVLDQVLDCRRHLDVGDHLRLHVAAVRLLPDELPLLQPADHLEDEERHAVRLHRDLASQLLGQGIALEGVLEEMDDLPR
ncbi:MAG: hypothetical protein O7C98_09605 [Planctomycetota bacterium]|nr:hypothetical protein [Planctomycetota bacterium]